jgi:hypothetical protein
VDYQRLAALVHYLPQALLSLLWPESVGRSCNGRKKGETGLMRRLTVCSLVIVMVTAFLNAH